MTGSSALEQLARADKWFLSAGEGLVWAPPFPVWLERPGFWDEAHLFERAIRPLFTVAFVDEGGREVPLVSQRRRWTPAALEAPYAAAGGFEFVESRMVLPGFVLASEWQVTNVGPSHERLHAVAWTTAPGEDVGPGDITHGEAGLSWRRVLRDAGGNALTVEFQLAMARGADSWGAVRSDPLAVPPQFALTPFWDRWDPMHGGLRGAAGLSGDEERRSIVFLGVHRALELEAGAAARVAVALRLVPDVVKSGHRESRAHPKAASFAAASRGSWEAFFAATPAFRCSDPYFERYWLYRWYGLRLNAIQGGWANYAAPTLATGIGELHLPEAGAAPAHVRELRWARDPEWARGVLRTFTGRVGTAGALPARVGLVHEEPGAPLADWGAALLAIQAVHPSDEFLREVVPALERHAEWLLATGAAEGGGLVDGATCWYRLCRALETLGGRGGVEAAKWRARAEQAGAALLKKMWDARSGVFADLSQVTGRRNGARAVTAFYPYATDLVAAPHLSGLVQNLFDPRQFWKPFPVPTLSGKDPGYDPDGADHGRRLERPWTGRVWPAANCHIAEAVAYVAVHHLPALRAHLVDLVTKTVRMMFWDGDASRPNCYEHYHPVSGRPSAYRGLDDHLHSWINDLIVQYVVGLRPEPEGRCVVDPMPFSLDGFEATGLPVQGALVDVKRSGEQVAVRVNGREAAKGRLGEPLVIRL